MKVALITDAFAPARTSGAIQMYDLAKAMARSGHEVVVFTPSPASKQPWSLEDRDGFKVLRLRSPLTKDISYVRRLWAEWRMPQAMYENWLRSSLKAMTFDGIACYSPSIFHTRLVRALKGTRRTRSYLILRDVFPDWALDMGLLKPGPVFRILKAIARRQYGVADVVGVQSPGNVPLIQGDARAAGTRIEVLHNWLEPRPDVGCSLDLSTSPLKGRKLCVYAGNIGVAQSLDVILDVADELRSRSDIGFVLVGRGNDVERLSSEIASRQLSNILMFDEIEAAEIPGLYSQCTLGLVVLDERHRTHNIPGKFVSYMHAGLPVLAIVNPGNDIIEMIRSSGVGTAIDRREIRIIARHLVGMSDDDGRRAELRERCLRLAQRQFSSDAAAAQIIRGLAYAH